MWPTDGGGRMRTRNKTGWNYSVQASAYRVLTNTTRQSNASDPFTGCTIGTTRLRAPEKAATTSARPK